MQEKNFLEIFRDKSIIHFLNGGNRGGLSSNELSRLVFSSEFVTYFSEYVTKDILDSVGVSKFLKQS